MRRRAARVVAGVVIAGMALAGCDRSAGAPLEAGKAERSPSTPASSPADVASLPAEGIVESGNGKVVVRRLDGTVATELPSMRLDEGASPAQPPLLVAGDGPAFRLLHRQLLPDPSANPDPRFLGDGARPALPKPPGAGLGHWRYAFPAEGTPRLAQWSGECEQPTAYEVIGGRPVALRASGASGAPVDSIALGLSMGGEPVVLFPPAPCGSAKEQVGVYVRHAGGEWQRVTASVSARYFRV